MNEIELTSGYITIVDDCDAEWLNQYRWRASVSKKDSPYVIRFKSVCGKRIAVLMHRLIMGSIVGRELTRLEIVDHINGNTLDNRRANLRLSTVAENSRNRGKTKTNTSGFKGVFRNKNDGSWYSIITVDRKGVFLGRFQDKIEAAHAYDRGALWYHGEFANLNFPNLDYGSVEKPNRPRQKGRTLKENKCADMVAAIDELIGELESAVAQP